MATVEIKLTQGKVALIDEADLPLVSQYKWHAAERENTWYAATSAMRRRTGECIYLHRLIAGATADQDVDHKDGDGLNCQRDNLRPCTNAQNRRNMRVCRGESKYKGVAVAKGNSTRKWSAYIWFENRKIGLGNYETEAEAARAYNAAALTYHGEFACLNKISGMSYEESVTPPVRNRRAGRPPVSRDGAGPVAPSAGGDAVVSQSNRGLRTVQREHVRAVAERSPGEHAAL
jgi:hypothetical protein